MPTVELRETKLVPLNTPVVEDIRPVPLVLIVIDEALRLLAPI